MNLRRKKPSDSLYMLLDTMCNAFGGIILLAVLVVLLTNTQRRATASATDTPDMLQRRLTIAQTNLQFALQLQANLESKTNDARTQVQVSLLAQRQQLQNEIKAIKDATELNVTELDATASNDPAERARSLNAKLAAVQLAQTGIQNIIAAANEETNRLNARISSLETQVSALVHDSQRKLRLPKEHDTSKRVVYIIARFGRIYPCRNRDLSRNEIDIEWSDGETSESALPRVNRGIDIAKNPEAMRAYFKSLSDRSVYLVFCVYEESFPAFIQAKQFAVESGMAYGWEPYRLVDTVAFSESGYRPKPQ